MGSARERETPVPNEYRVSGVLWYSGRGVTGAKEETMAALGVDCWLTESPGKIGDVKGLRWMPRPGSMFSSNLECLPYVSSSLVRCGTEAYSGRDMRISGEPKGDIKGVWGCCSMVVISEYKLEKGIAQCCMVSRV